MLDGRPVGLGELVPDLADRLLWFRRRRNDRKSQANIDHRVYPERAYCCAKAIYENWDDFQDDPASAEEMLRNFLELDRGEVYRACVAYLLKPLP